MIIESLKIVNFSLIKEINIDFHKQLNVFYGESGSGKSLIFKAIRMILGASSSPDMIRPGQDKCILSLTIKNTDHLDFQIEGFPQIGEFFTIEKIITPSKSYWRIDGEQISQKYIKNFYQLYFQSFTQGDQFILSDKKYQMSLTNVYHAKSVVMMEVEKLSKEYHNRYDYFLELQKSLEVLDRDYDYNKYCYEEFDNLMISNQNELEDLLNKTRDVEDQKHIVEYCNELLDKDIVFINEEFISKLSKVIDIKDTSVSDRIDKLSDSIDYLENKVKQTLNSIQDIDEEQRLILQEQKNLYYNLLKKHRCNSFEELMSVNSSFYDKINGVESLKSKINDIKKELEQKKQKYIEKCRELYEIRKKAAKEISVKMKQHLLDLNFTYIDFYEKITFDENRKVNPSGLDDLEYYISFNKGIDAKPLRNTISGGEASRISLCFLDILGLSYNIYLLDEIDSGLDEISLDKLSKKLRVICDNSNQIICISHNKSILDIADKQIKIYKEQQGDLVETKMG